MFGPKWSPYVAETSLGRVSETATMQIKIEQNTLGGLFGVLLSPSPPIPIPGISQGSLPGEKQYRTKMFWGSCFVICCPSPHPHPHPRRQSKFPSGVKKYYYLLLILIFPFGVKRYVCTK